MLKLQGHVLVIYVIGSALLLTILFGYQAVQPYTISMELNGEVTEVETYTKTVGQLFDELHIEYTSRDELSHSPQERLEDDMHIQLNEAVQVTFVKYGESQDVWTTQRTVGDFLQEQQTELQDGDVVTPGLHFPIASDLTIEQAHYEQVIVSDEYHINYQVVKTEDDSILVGQEKVVQYGQQGTGKHSYKVTYKNGQEVQREFVDQHQVQEKVDEIIAVGTKEPPPPKPVVTVASSSGSGSSSGDQTGRVMTMQSTAYSVDCLGCDGKGITATGINLKKNPDKKVIAVDPRVIPLGSIVKVEGYGTAIAGDTGGAIKGNIIDVFIPNKADVRKWGRRTVRVEILE